VRHLAQNVTFATVAELLNSIHPALPGDNLIGIPLSPQGGENLGGEAPANLQKHSCFL